MLLNTKILFFCLLSAFPSSEWGINQYDKKKAESILLAEFLKDEFWTMPSNIFGRVHFNTKSEFHTQGSLVAIPILHLSKNFDNFNYTEDISNCYEPDYSIFVGVIYKRKKPLDIMFVEYFYDKKNNIIPSSALANSPRKICKEFERYPEGFFYDSFMQAFCSYRSNQLFVYSYFEEKWVTFNRFIEKQRGGLEMFKKSVMGK